MDATPDPRVFGVRVHARDAKEHSKAARIDTRADPGGLRDRAKRLLREERRARGLIGPVDTLAGVVEANEAHRPRGDRGQDLGPRPIDSVRRDSSAVDRHRHRGAGIGRALYRRAIGKLERQVTKDGVEPRPDRDEALHAFGVQHPAVRIDDAKSAVVLHAARTELDRLERLDRERLYRRDVNPRDARTHRNESSTGLTLKSCGSSR